MGHLQVKNAQMFFVGSPRAVVPNLGMMTPKGIMSLFLGVMEGSTVTIAPLSLGTLFKMFKTRDNCSLKFLSK